MLNRIDHLLKNPNEIRKLKKEKELELVDIKFNLEKNGRLLRRLEKQKKETDINSSATQMDIQKLMTQVSELRQLGQFNNIKELGQLLKINTKLKESLNAINSMLKRV